AQTAYQGCRSNAFTPSGVSPPKEVLRQQVSGKGILRVAGNAIVTELPMIGIDKNILPKT
ncbi:MAG: hypothetical protein VX920_02715, partial [Pseudomonadota bacterium]|nr:hypothetical protein [Pseudomonadota bacterium]